jgi:hypothetical protein
MGVAGDGRGLCGFLGGDQDFRSGRMDVWMDKKRRCDDRSLDEMRHYNSGSSSSISEAAHYLFHGCSIHV